MPSHRRSDLFFVDAGAAVRSDERLLLLLFLLLSIAALAVFLHYTALVLGGLPEVIPS